MVEVEHKIEDRELRLWLPKKSRLAETHHPFDPRYKKKTNLSFKPTAPIPCPSRPPTAPHPPIPHPSRPTPPHPSHGGFLKQNSTEFVSPRGRQKSKGNSSRRRQKFLNVSARRRQKFFYNFFSLQFAPERGNPPILGGQPALIESASCIQKIYHFRLEANSGVKFTEDFLKGSARPNL